LDIRCITLYRITFHRTSKTSSKNLDKKLSSKKKNKDKEKSLEQKYKEVDNLLAFYDKADAADNEKRDLVYYRKNNTGPLLSTRKKVITGEPYVAKKSSKKASKEPIVRRFCPCCEKEIEGPYNNKEYVSIMKKARPQEVQEYPDLLNVNGLVKANEEEHYPHFTAKEVKAIANCNPKGLTKDYAESCKKCFEEHVKECWETEPFDFWM